LPRQFSVRCRKRLVPRVSRCLLSSLAAFASWPGSLLAQGPESGGAVAFLTRPAVIVPGMIGLVVLVGIVSARLWARGRALWARVELFEVLVDDAPEALLVVDWDRMVVVHANRAALSLFGYSKADMDGLPVGSLHRVLQPDGSFSREVFHTRVAETLAGASTLLEWWCVDAGGRQIPCEIRVTPVPLDGPTRIRLRVTDLTKEREVDRRRRDLEARLRAARRWEAVGRITGGVAHDFNNLLTSVIGNLDFIANKLGDRPELARMARSAAESAFRGSRLTSQLVAYSGRQVLHPKPVDLGELVKESREILESMVGDGVGIRMEVEEALPPSRLDEAGVREVLVNLILNAKEAMPEGGRVTIGVRHLYADDAYVARHRGMRAGEYVLLEVADTGTGMSNAVRAQAFEPFFTTGTPGAKSGLGLSMVYGFVKQSGGYTSLESEVDKGTTVTIYFPVHHGSGTHT